MYGTRDYSAHLGYAAMRIFQVEILRGHGNFWSWKKNIYRSCIPIDIARSLRCHNNTAGLKIVRKIVKNPRIIPIEDFLCLA